MFGFKMPEGNVVVYSEEAIEWLSRGRSRACRKGGGGCEDKDEEEPEAGNGDGDGLRGQISG
jgi:hypothetical protein